MLISASRGLRHDETERLAPWFDLRTQVLLVLIVTIIAQLAR